MCCGRRMMPFFGLSISRRSGCSSAGCADFGGEYFGSVAPILAAVSGDVARAGAARAGAAADVAGVSAGWDGFGAKGGVVGVDSALAERAANSSRTKGLVLMAAGGGNHALW